MVERLLKYRNKCKVLKQIHSNKAQHYRKVNFIQNLLTIVVSGFMTFIAFSGFDTIYDYLQSLFPGLSIGIEHIQMSYNILVFLLFLLAVLHIVFRFNDQQTASERAIPLLSTLINEIDDILERTPTIDDLTSISQKYVLIIQMIPPNTDREYFSAKKQISRKSETQRQKRFLEKPNVFNFSSSQQQEDYIISILEKNKTVQQILNQLQQQDESLYLGGGVIRNLIWDNLHGYKKMTPIDDIDVIYYNKLCTSKERDKEIESKLHEKMSTYKWSVKNQARMHTINNDDPYMSLYDAVSKWPETASAMLFRKDKTGTYDIVAPFGFDDLFKLIVRPTPHFYKKLDKYQQRVSTHNWQKNWNRLTILYMEDETGSKASVPAP